MVVPFIDHITSSRQVDMKEEAIGRIISGFDDLLSYWFFISPSIMKSICYAYPLISKGITLLLSRLCICKNPHKTLYNLTNNGKGLYRIVWNF